MNVTRYLLHSGYQGNLQDIFVRQQSWGDYRRVAIRTLSEDGAERITKPTVANALIVAGKSSPVRIVVVIQSRPNPTYNER